MYYVNKNIVINIYMIVIFLNFFIVDGKKIRNNMIIMREAGLFRLEAGFDSRLIVNGVFKVFKEEEECYVL